MSAAGEAAVSAARTARGECSWGRQPLLPRGLLGVSAAGEAAVSAARTARGECSWGRQPFLPRGLLGVSAAGEGSRFCREDCSG